MPRVLKISPELIIQTYKKLGSQIKAARRLGVSPATVAYHLHNAGVIARRHRTTEIQEFTERDDPLLRQLIKIHPKRWRRINARKEKIDSP